MLDLIIRNTHKRSDFCFLAIASIVGIAAGYVVAQFAPLIAVPFSLAAIALLHFTWRTP